MSSINKKVGIAAIIMMISVLLSRVIGLLREMVIAYLGGVEGSVDAYQVAFVIPEILNHVIASGFLSITFIPMFSKYIADNNETEGWKSFSVIMNVFGLILLVGIVISVVFAPELVRVLAPGIGDTRVETDAIRMTRIIIPAQFFFFIGGLFMAVQYSKEQFLFPALAPLLYNIGIIMGGICLFRFIGMDGFAWGVLGGAFLGNCLIQYFGAKKIGMKYSFVFDFRHRDLKTYILLTLPLMIGLTMTFSTEVFLKFFGSFLPPGRIAALNYSLRIIFILVGFFGQAVGTASYPFLAGLVAKNKIKEMNQLLDDTLKRYIAMVIPFSILMMLLRQEIVMILFQRGRFDTIATDLTSDILIYLLPGAFAFSAQTVVVRGYYAMKNTLFPAVFGTLAVLASIPFYWYGMKLMGACGVALVISLSAIFQVITLYVIWNYQTANDQSRFLYMYFLKIIFLSLVIGLFLLLIKTRLSVHIDSGNLLGSLIMCFLISSVFCFLFFFSGYVMKIKEFQYVFEKIKSKRLI